MQKICRDRHTKSRTLDVAVGLFVDTLKCLKKTMQVFLPDPRSGVFDLKMQDFRIFFLVPGHGKIDTALSGVFDGIAHDIIDDLAQAQGISPIHGRQFLIHMDMQIQALFLSTQTEYRHGIV